MSGWTRGRLFAALNAAALASVVGLALVLSAGPALADPDPAPGDPGVVAAPPGPPAPPPDPLAAPPPPDPLAPPPFPGLPAPMAQPAAAGPAAGQDPTPFTGTAPFGPPRFVPANGSMVGVAQPVIINFPGRVDDAGAAESAVHVSSIPPVPGKFYWMTPTQLRWRPLSFWPANTAVNIDAGGTKSSFRTGGHAGGDGR